MPDGDLEELDIEQVESDLGGGGPSAPPDVATGGAGAVELQRLDSRIKQIDRDLQEAYERYKREYADEVAKTGDGYLATSQWQTFRKEKETQRQRYEAQRETVRKNLAAEDAKAAAAAKPTYVKRRNPATGKIETIAVSGTKTTRVEGLDEDPDNPYDSPSVIAAGISQRSQGDANALQKWIHEQDNLIRKGDIDARTAKSNLDSQMEFLKWALPKDTKYRPGFEPGGPIARSYQASGQSYDPESPQNRIMGFVDPFQATQQMGTPFGTYGGPAPQSAQPAMPPANPQQFAGAQQGPSAPAPAPVPQLPDPAFAAAQQPWFNPGPSEANPLPPWYDPNDPYGGMG